MKPLHDYTVRVCSSLFGVGNAGVMERALAASFTDLVARVEALEAAQNLQQQDEDTERAAPAVKDSLTVHFATDEELSQLYYEACGGHEDSLRAVYDLGRQHGASQSTCPYIRSSDEGTSYCALAEQSANSRPAPNDLHLLPDAMINGWWSIEGCSRQWGPDMVEWTVEITPDETLTMQCHKSVLHLIEGCLEKAFGLANSKSTPNSSQIGTSVDTGLLPMIVSETGSDDEPETERIICSSISGGADYVNGMPRELSLERIRYGLHIGSLRTSARYVQAPLEVVGPTPAPAGELKEMLIKVFNEGLRLRRYAATDVIEAVADWLEHQRDILIGVSVEYIAAMLRKEAGR